MLYLDYNIEKVYYLEEVEGISRLTEVMYIKRDSNGVIEKVFDVDMNVIDITSLHKSFMIRVEKNGFY